MHDIEGLIEAAEILSTSGRQDKLNKKIFEFSQNAKADNIWLEKVFSGLVYRNFHDFLKMKEIMADNNGGDNLSVAAYYARNILEVSVWTAFCFQSVENAHQFYCDVGRDSDDLLKWNLRYGIESVETNTAREEIKAQAAKENVSDIEKKFTDVRAAAKKIDMQDIFSIQNKVFSKFAHPTALQIILPQTGQAAQNLKRSFYGQACVLFTGCFHILEKRYGLSNHENLN